MHIVCPHCSTSYAINLPTLGPAGRTVRCSRCKETWLARPEDAVKLPAPAMAEASRKAAEQDAAAEWEALAREEDGNAGESPHVDSPSIAVDWGDSAGDSAASTETDWPSIARDDLHGAAAGRLGPSWLPGLLGRRAGARASSRGPGKPSVSLPTACAAMGALVLALLIWRLDVVRLLPQTAAFYKMVGLDVNLRGLRFKDVKVSSETVEGKPVLVIEGVITGEFNKPVELPRLRFSVRDAQGAEIYAWNTVLEQTVLSPGEKAWFKSRLASPPPEGRNIDVRFFNKRDMAGGHI
ncbi:MAG TPA: MJ0042-type zinc finger domain-containing protein [Bradyrhizobium sp.]|nr:MJ0042-type zinc finger domain-containing protein [Bradyrhizobium sp.]